MLLTINFYSTSLPKRGNFKSSRPEVFCKKSILRYLFLGLSLKLYEKGGSGTGGFL